MDDTFVQLFSELSEQVELITPRLAALEARGRVLRDGIEEERKARIRHYTEILVPVKVGIALRIIGRIYIYIYIYSRSYMAYMIGIISHVWPI